MHVEVPPLISVLGTWGGILQHSQSSNTRIRNIQNCSTNARGKQIHHSLGSLGNYFPVVSHPNVFSHVIYMNIDRWGREWDERKMMCCGEVLFSSHALVYRLHVQDLKYVMAGFLPAPFQGREQYPKLSYESKQHTILPWGITEPYLQHLSK